MNAPREPRLRPCATRSNQLTPSLARVFLRLHKPPMELSFSAALKAIREQRPTDLSDRDKTGLSKTIPASSANCCKRQLSTAARLELLSRPLALALGAARKPLPVEGRNKS